MRPRGLVIAIDGPSGAGKSTAARLLARRLGYLFVDTGAMYRALALKALRGGTPLDDEGSLAARLGATRIELRELGSAVELDGRPVTADIRTQEVSEAASRVSVHPGVRREMVARQRELGRSGGVVLDGRDIGTAVFPDAEAKFFVDADARERALRRHAELRATGVDVDLALIEREIRERDHNDSTRSDSPLTRAPDALLIDTTHLGPEAVVERMLEVVKRRSALSRQEG